MTQGVDRWHGTIGAQKSVGKPTRRLPAQCMCGSFCKCCLFLLQAPGSDLPKYWRGEQPKAFCAAAAMENVLSGFLLQRQ